MEKASSPKDTWTRRARQFLVLELVLSMLFNVAMMSSVHRGQWMNLLLTVVIALNVLAAARLFTKLRGTNCASSITAYVVWKVFQEIIVVPVLVIFTFIMVDQYIKSWSSSETAIQVLVIVWLYACYSLFLILYLGQLARTLWKRKAARQRRNSDCSAISFISGCYEELTAERRSRILNEAPEGQQIPLEEHNLIMRRPEEPNNDHKSQPLVAPDAKLADLRDGEGAVFSARAAFYID